VRKVLLIVFVIIGAVYVYLVSAVEDDKRWFHAFSRTGKTVDANLKFDSLQYSAYRWRTNQKTQEFELFLAYYIKIDKDGSYLSMRHNTTPEPALYFEGSIESSVHRLLDSLAIVTLDTLYIKPEFRIYDGNTFRLNVAARGEHNIHFYQIDAPPYLQRVASALDNVIFKSSATTSPYDLSFHEQELKRHSLQLFGELPRREAPKFK
jgi:hypothetical protein